MASHGVNDSDESVTLFDTWRSLTETAVTSARATNRAMLAPLKASAAFARSFESHIAASIPSLVYEEPDWTSERSVETVEAIAVGDTVRFSKTITESDVEAFAHVSGDTNRLHLDEAFAEGTRFGERIAHGTLVAGMISAALARLPGLTIYLSQDLEFVAPVSLGTRLTAVVEVVEDLGDGQYLLATDIVDETDQQIIDGEAVVLIDPIDTSVE